MKVLHIGKYYFPFFGGIEKVTQELVENEVYSESVTSCVLVHQHLSSLHTSYETINNVEVRKVAISGVFAYAPIAPTFLYELNKAIDEFQPDIIHVQMPNLSAFTCLLSSKAKKIPWVIHWQSDVIGAVPDFKIKLLYPFYRIFEKALLKQCQKIITTSPPYLECSSALTEYKSKCSVIPIGIKDSVDASLSPQQNNGLSLLMIGRLTYYKGHELILKALSQFTDEKVTLTIIGSGELKEKLVGLANTLQLNDKVNFLGSVDGETLAAELVNTDLLCLPSIEKTEAFGVVLLEAAMHGKPALVSNVEGSGMSWVVQDAQTGFVVKSNNVDAIVQSLTNVINNKEQLKSLGVNARTRFEQTFNLNVVAKQIIDVYLTCLKR
ncbi:glycosyltransferase [Pseudoalteromonas spongiae]|uniref:Glycosyltransferase n=1 Tax=Pseudoalteromonas spongiae TaxID=298657 RepID=A0ABU8END8_9GAMM